MVEGRVLVTGATGFVGRRLASHLAEAGFALTLATRRDGVSMPKGTACRAVIVGQIDSHTLWDDALEGASSVVHLAAHVHVAPERAEHEAQLFDEVNHHGTLRLFDEAARHGVRTFVFVSSITVLGSASPAGGAFDESSEPRPETPYARSKMQAELALRERAADKGVTLVILRPPLIAGEGVAGNLGSLARLAASPWPLPLGGIDNRRTLLSLDNLVSAITTVLERPSAGTFLIGDAEPLSTSAIVRALRAGAGRSAPVVPVPARLAARLAGLAGYGGHAQRLLGDLVLDSSAFRRTFGWRDVIDTRTTLRRVGAAVRHRTPGRIAGPVPPEAMW